MKRIAAILVGAAAGSLVVSLFLVAAAPQTVGSGHPRWEYRTVSLALDLSKKRTGIVGKDRYRDIEKRLNELGSEGWELSHAAGDLFIFKRRSEKP